MPQLDNLGLRENPFKNNTDQRFFYADQNRAQILESAEHLIEYSNSLQVIIGSSGVGKSHLLSTLASRLDKNRRIAKINIVEQYDTLSLIQAILDAFGATHDDGVDLLETLETQLAEIIQLGFKPVLFVDDAEALSADSIRFLLQLSQQKQNDEAYINIVLFATVEITEHLQSPELRDYRDIIHIATLSNLDKEGVSGYLRHKMAVAGFDRESPFTPRIIDSIFNDSNGIPEKINFYANKFLVSSGKGENYIETGSSHEREKYSHEPETKNVSAKQANDFMTALIDEDLHADRSDRAEEQINRLAEKFDEIEQMGEQSVSDFTDKEFIDKDYEKDDHVEGFDNESSIPHYDDELRSVGLPKFIIPIAIIGSILAAIVIINTVFDNSDRSDGEQVKNGQIELLPLELPSEAIFSPEDQAEEVVTTQIDNAPDLAQDNNTVQTRQVDSEPAAAEVALVEIETTEINVAQPIPAASTSAPEIEQITSTDSKPLPQVKLKRVEPEPIIGSKKRQTVTIIGSELDKETILVLTWAGNTKEFSAKQTPEQWNYINKNRIKLHLTTGIETQQWQVYAKNTVGQQSQAIQFDVVKPFIEEMAIKAILPNPFIGSDKRQTVTIMGQGFSKQTVIELKWDKNSKHFSSSLSPNQFEYISSNEIRLFITTGKKERKWKVFAKQAGNGVVSSSSFSVVSNDNQSTVSSARSLKDEPANLHSAKWLIQQPDSHYTIQLFGSHNKQAIDELIRTYALKGDIAWFETQRNGQSWYSMTYGNYDSKPAADKAVESLNAQLTNPKPWVRNFASVKKQLSLSTQVAEINKTVETRTASTIPTQTDKSKTRNEAWIWTQNPTNYTLQLLALSTESAVKNYAIKHKIEAQSVHFKIIRNGKPLYVLIYGNYQDKKSAEQANELLRKKIEASKPWIRSFSEIHSLMTP